MANENLNKPVRLSALDKLAALASTEIKKVADSDALAFKHIEKDGNTLKVYTVKTPEEGATPAYSIDFPAESFLDQANTTFATNFTFNAETYVGATNPNLDGRPVIILAVKTTDAQNNTTINYSFIDVKYLVDTYTAKAGDSAKVLNIAGYEIEFKISAEDGNALTVKNDGLYATARVAGAVKNNVAIFGDEGAVTDSGIAKGQVILQSDFASDDEVNEVLNSYFGTNDSGE